MDAELDTLATALYVKIDDALKDNPGLAPRRPVVGICPKLSDAELLTLCVLQALGGFVSDARFLRHARAHLLDAFPYLPGQPGYNKRVRKAIPQLKAMIRLLACATDTFFDDLWVIDSTPVECGRSRPTAKRSDLAGFVAQRLARSKPDSTLRPAQIALPLCESPFAAPAVVRYCCARLPPLLRSRLRFSLALLSTFHRADLVLR